MPLALRIACALALGALLGELALRVGARFVERLGGDAVARGPARMARTYGPLLVLAAALAFDATNARAAAGAATEHL